VGDPAYDLWPLVAQIGDPHSGPNLAAQLAHQLTIAAEAAGVDPARAGAWAFARAGLSLTWYLADGDDARAAREADVLTALAEISGY
jgi:streptomycin 6-kinase